YGLSSIALAMGSVPDINIDTDESLDSNVGQNVQTGDQSNIMLDLALMFISLFFLIKNLTLE
ncbi:hypothetical protein, partial [Klebsiella aerogenes]|uniref:hypothetical protein n=1 Tax=Klebsiella aerogenes TaxID=548 RepID=UPI0013D6CCFE